MAKAKVTAEAPLEIERIRMQTIEAHILGTSPLIMNRQSEKAKRQLLLPPQTKNRAQKQTTLKHVPFDEFRASAYCYRDDTAPTRCFMPSTSIKKAIMTAAMDLPGGSTKAGVGRHVSVLDENFPVYGVPRLRADMVRQAGIQRTPDVRFRCEFEYWACTVRIRFALLGLTGTSVLNLVAAAGEISGIGDFRQEKGAGHFGKFMVVDEQYPEWEMFQDIIKTGGREAQDTAIANPAMSVDTEELLLWFDEEIARRGRQKEVEAVEKANVADKAKTKRNGRGKEAN